MTTRDEIMAMDEDALRLAVAKAWGWTGIYPDPLTISIAYELEDALPENLHPLYSANLIHLMADASGEMYVNDWWRIHASAADRCRAWLLTMGSINSDTTNSR